jgi:hypothetical protein
MPATIDDSAILNDIADSIGAKARASPRRSRIAPPRKPH